MWIKKGSVNVVAEVAIAVLVAALLISGCAKEVTPMPAPPAEEKTVTFSINADLTSPVSGVTKYHYVGFDDYIRRMNEKDGVDGVKIDLLWSDDGMNIEKTTTSWKKFAEKHPLVHYSMSWGAVALKSEYEEEGLLVVVGGVTDDMLMPEPCQLYTWSFNYSEMGAAIMDWIKDDWKKSGGGASPKVAFLGVTRMNPGKAIIKASQIYSEKLGIEIGAVVDTPMQVLDSKPQLLVVQKDAPDYVFIVHMAGVPGVILKDAASLGILDKTKWVINSVDMETLAVAGEFAEGLYALAGHAAWSEDVPGVKQMIETQMEYHQEVHQEGCYVCGWQNGAIACEALRLALGEVGYDNLNGPATKAAINRIKGLETGGICPPMDFTHPDEQQGQWSSKMTQAQNGIFIPITGWITPPHMTLYQDKLYSLPERVLYQ